MKRIIVERFAGQVSAKLVGYCEHPTYRDGLCARCGCPETAADTDRAIASWQARQPKR